MYPSGIQSTQAYFDSGIRCVDLRLDRVVSRTGDMLPHPPASCTAAEVIE